MSKEIIDFSVERARHPKLFGREAILSRLGQYALTRRAPWLLLTGSPGIGKSAILSHFIDYVQEAAPHFIIAYHFLRRGVADWARPLTVRSSLAAQLEVIYPQLADAEAPPARRLIELIYRISKQILIPQSKHLLLIIDGLDEVEPSDEGNPLPQFLPPIPIAAVSVLCSSRPAYPNLYWIEERTPRRIDLDEPEWQASNEAACLQYWEHFGTQFEPPLTKEIIEQSVTKAQGNILHAVKLREWLDTLSPEERSAAPIPAGLAGFFEQLMQDYLSMQLQRREIIKTVLGLLCAAREPLPISLSFFSFI